MVVAYNILKNIFISKLFITIKPCVFYKSWANSENP